MKNKIPKASDGFIESVRTGTTTADVADLIEFAMNREEPKIKTKRGMGSSIETTVGGRKFVITVSKPSRKKAAPLAVNLSQVKELAEFAEKHDMQNLTFENADFKLTLSKSDREGIAFESELEAISGRETVLNCDVVSGKL